MRGPEARVKQKVREWMRNHGIYFHSPVPTGYGRSTLDDLVCVNGKFVGLEYKAKGEGPTARQRMIIEEIRAAGGLVFWSHDPEYLIWEIGNLLAS